MQKSTTSDANRTAIERIATENYSLFYGIAFTVLRNHHLSEDAVQSSVLKALESSHQLADLKSGVSWLSTIVRRTALDKATRRRREPRLSLAQTLSPPSTTPKDASSDELEAVFDAISRLPEHLALAFLMRFREGLSSSDIGERLAITPSHARVRIVRAASLLSNDTKLLKSLGLYR